MVEENRFSTFGQFQEIENISKKLRGRFTDIKNFMDNFFIFFKGEVLGNEEKIYRDWNKIDEYNTQNFENFLNYFKEVTINEKILTVDIIKRLGYSLSPKNQNFRKGKVKVFTDTQKICSPSDIEPFLYNTLLWFSEEEGGVAMLHPIEKSVLFTLRLCDFMPFEVGNLTLVRWISFFYLFKNFIVPPFNVDLKEWQRSLNFAFNNFLTTGLTMMYRNLAIENGKRFIKNELF